MQDPMIDYRLLNPRRNPAFSPNLYKFLKREAKKGAFDWQVWFSADPGHRPVLGYRDISDDRFLIGALLWQVLGNNHSEVYAYTPRVAATYTSDETFWDRYLQIGRCALDPEHERYFLTPPDRWSEEGDVRTCLWCGHVQQKHRWSERVVREAWRPARPDMARRLAA